MTRLEKAALNHAAEEIRYQRSPQAKIDAAFDRKRRIQADKKAGHSPACGIMKCHPSCPSLRCD